MAMGVRTRCAASAIKSSDRDRDFCNLDISELRDDTSGAISVGTGAATGRKSLGPRRETEPVKRCNGRIVLCEITMATTMDNMKNPNPMANDIREMRAIDRFNPVRVCATEISR